MTYVSAVVEGVVDEAVALRLYREVGVDAGPIHIKGGKSALLEKVGGYNHAAAHSPWFVLVDLDRDHECAPPFRARHLPAPSRLMCFRVAVRAVETRMLADRRRFADFLGVSARRIPMNVESIPDPKQLVVDLARTSTKVAVRNDLVPRPGSGRRTGALYASALVRFVTDRWRPDTAADGAESLRRSLDCLAALNEAGE